MNRRRAVHLTVLLAAAVVAAATPAYAADGPTSPDGLGGLFDTPDLAGANGKSLFEATDDNDYGLYADLGITDVKEGSAAVIYAPFLGLALAFTRLAIGLTWWLNSLTSRDAGLGVLGDQLQVVAADLNGWLLPTALAAGVVSAYAAARQGRDAFGQIVWTIGLGVGAVAIALSGSSILSGIDSGRQLLSKTVSAVGPNTSTVSKTPFEWPGTDLDTGDDANDVARTSGDAVWRMYAVVPWCQAQFGSQEACERYGAQWLAIGNNQEDRERFVKKVIEQQEGGDDAPTVEFVKGKRPAERITIALFAFVTSIGVAAVIGGLALLALMPWVTAILLMFLAVVFLCLLCVPGRLRSIGMNFVQLIGGLVLLSALTTGILTGALLATVAATSLAGSLGWLPSAVMTTTILVAAWQARSILERILFVPGDGTRGSALATALGLTAMRRLVGGRGAAGGRDRGRSGQGARETGEGASARRRSGSWTRAGQRFRTFGRRPAEPADGTRTSSTTRTNPRHYGSRDDGPTRTHEDGLGGRTRGRGRGGEAREHLSPDRQRARERLQERNRGKRPTPRGGYESRYDAPTPGPKNPPTKKQQQPQQQQRKFTDYSQRQDRARTGQSAGRRRFSHSRRRAEGQE